MKSFSWLFAVIPFIFILMGLTRRDLLIGIAGLSGASLIPARETIGESSQDEKQPRAKRASTRSESSDEKGVPFSFDEKKTLSAMVERLLPGAVAAGVPDYIDYWLSQRPFRSVRNYVAHGAMQLSRLSKREFSKSFADCSAQQQDTLLGRFAEGRIRIGKFTGQIFFQQMMELTLEGFLSDPKYGGNKDRVGWRFIGIPDGLRSCWWNPNGVEMVLRPDEGFHD